MKTVVLLVRTVEGTIVTLSFDDVSLVKHHLQVVEAMSLLREEAPPVPIGFPPE